MMRRGRSLLAGLIPMVAAGGLACGGDSPLEIPTPTTEATAVTTQPTQVSVVTPTTAPAVTPTQTGSTGGEQMYTVQAGDTLGAIATQFGVTVDAIVQANEITDPNLIVPGETLIIPAAQ